MFNKTRAAAARWKKTRYGRLLYRAAHVVVPVLLIILVVRSVGAGEVAARLSEAKVGWIIASLVACSVQIVLCALRWKATAAPLGAPISTATAVSEYYFSSVINATVPGGVVGDAIRAVRSRGAAGLESAAQGVILERLAGQIALGAVLLAGLLLSGVAWLQAAGGLALAAVAGAGGLVALLRWRGAERLLPGVIRRFLSAMRLSWSGRRRAGVQIVLSLGIVAANLAGFVFAARATGATIGFPEMLYAVPLILAAMLIPFSVGGWGYREGVAAAIFPLIGGSAAAGVGASMIFGAVLLVASLPGAAVLLLRRGPAAPSNPSSPSFRPGAPRRGSGEALAEKGLAEREPAE